MNRYFFGKILIFIFILWKLFYDIKKRSAKGNTLDNVGSIIYEWVNSKNSISMSNPTKMAGKNNMVLKPQTT